MTSIREQLVAEARSWIGTPYAPYGRVRGKAADCVFLEEVGNKVLGTRWRHKGYSLVPYDRQLERVTDEIMVIVADSTDGPINESMLEIGMCALFYGVGSKEPQHFGMVARHKTLPHVFTLIHAGGNVIRGRVCERSFSNQKLYMDSIVKLYDFPGVVDG